jgi:tetratricopeptide (TPR) repeat protein
LLTDGGLATGPGKASGSQMQSFFAQVDREVAPLELGLFRRARLATSFKYKLLDHGVEPAVVDELTQALLLRVAEGPAPTMAADAERFETTASAPKSTTPVEMLLSKAAACSARGEHAQAVELYQELVKLKPRHLVARNNLGVALVRLGRQQEAEEHFRRAVGIQSTYAEAQFNLGAVLRALNKIVESEMPARRAVKLDPKHVDALASLGVTLLLSSRLSEARECFEKALRMAPRHAGSLCGLGMAASLAGRFEEAESLFKRALVFDTRMPAALAGLAGLRKMTTADRDWVQNAEKVAAGGVGAVEEAQLRFAIGKYYDDVGKFDEAFRHYQRGNELRKTLVEPYDHEERERFVDDMIRVHQRDSFASMPPATTDSSLPVFVTGMPRSGTSLVEQIISSHPDARGAGELSYWNDAMRKHRDAMRNKWLAETLRKKLADQYLRTLSNRFPHAKRVVDQSNFNTDHLGPIHAMLPGARLIYVRRDPLDTCLSCYFHPLAQNFTLDLADLAHYYGEHQRLLAHWRSVLPAGVLLEVPYAELVADQERWSRRIIEFIGLEWDERCLDFHATERPVMTASFWQVRQKMFSSSVNRWKRYEKFIGPLKELTI